MIKEEERVIIFIDGSNLYHIVKGLIPEKRPNNFNFEKFADYLTKGRKLIGIYYYNVPSDRRNSEENYIKQQKFFDKIKRIPNFNFILCRMQKRRVNGEIIYEAKEDDIHLAVDMVDLACDDRYDTAILVSSDGDFVPAVTIAKNKGKRVENIGFENKFSYHLKQVCNNFIKLSRVVVDGFFNV